MLYENKQIVVACRETMLTAIVFFIYFVDERRTDCAKSPF